MNDRRFAALGVLLVALVPLAWCFGEPLLAGKSFALRDTARFYYPLFEWVEGEWSAGRVPLWNPLENGGAPVVGDTTSSIFYPGKLLLRLPLGFALKFKLYIVLHVLAAFATAYVLARSWKTSWQAAGLCAVSYAFGGYILFQHANVVFLVSAAWLPLSVLATDRMLRRRSAYWAVLLGITLAMMTLGGDPQAAYHTGMLAAGYALLLTGCRRRRRSGGSGARLPDPPTRSGRTAPRPRSRARQATREAARQAAREAARARAPAGVVPGRAGSLVRQPLVLLVIAAAVGATLAAIQIVPSAQWSGRSERASFREPRNIYQVPVVLMRQGNRQTVGGPRAASAGQLVRQGLLGSPVPGTHHRNLYHFSIQPWRLLELFWPNIGGKPYPINRNLMLALNQGEPDWTPSLYFGILPVLLSLATWSLRGHSLRVRWMSWTVLLAVLGSFGWYGPGWLWQAIGSLAGAGNAGGAGAAIGEPVGGLYWLMMLVLPGYDQFRYPAKLFLFASLGLSVLAAVGWDRTCRGCMRPLRPALLLAGISGIGLLATLALRPMLASFLAMAPPDPMFGPLAADRAAGDLALCMAHALLVAATGGWLLTRFRGAAEREKGRQWPQLCALALTTVELALAQGWMIGTAPDALWQNTGWAGLVMRQDAVEERAEHPESSSGIVSESLRRDFRVSRHSSPLWQPLAWSMQASDDRLQRAVQWHRDTLHSRFQLSAGIAVDEAATSVVADDYQAAIGIARSYGPRGLGGAPQPHPQLLDALGIRYLVQPADEGVSRQNTSLGRVVIGEQAGQDATVWLNPRQFPRAWIVHRMERMPDVDIRDPDIVDALTTHAFFPNEGPRDLRSEATFEVPRRPRPLVRPAEVVPAEEFCRVDYDGPQRVEIRVALNNPGLVVLSDLYDPDWTARVTTEGTNISQRVDVVRANRIMRGVFLPPGGFTIVYRYRPWGFWLGAAVSGLGWLTCAALLSWRGWRRSIRFRFSF